MEVIACFCLFLDNESRFLLAICYQTAAKRKPSAQFTLALEPAATHGMRLTKSPQKKAKQVDMNAYLARGRDNIPIVVNVEFATMQPAGTKPFFVFE